MSGPEDLERKMQYRTQMMGLASLNNPETIAKALKATKDTLTGLKPMQPPDLQGLIIRLQNLPLATGNQVGDMGRAVDVLTGSWSLDRKRCNSILEEWML